MKHFIQYSFSIKFPCPHSLVLGLKPRASTNKASALLRSYFPSAIKRYLFVNCFLLLWCQGSNKGPHTCRANALLLNYVPDPHPQFFKYVLFLILNKLTLNFFLFSNTYLKETREFGLYSTHRHILKNVNIDLDKRDSKCPHCRDTLVGEII